MTPQQTEADDRFAADELRIRIGTLLKTDTVSFLLGAGASKDCGGLLIGKMPPAIERSLHSMGISDDTDPRVEPWLQLFYAAAHRSAGGEDVPFDSAGILARSGDLASESVTALPVNFERLLTRLHRWRVAVPPGSTRVQFDGQPPIDATAHELDRCLAYATRELARSCVLPTASQTDGLESFKKFLRKLLTRPLNLKRVNIFTLNYDTLVEQAADAEGVVLLDGFVGTQRRIFRPESYEQDLYFPAETTEGRVHRLDRVLHLYKLHGSITWVASTPSIDNPFGVSCQPFDPSLSNQLVVYPTPTKIDETLGMPYAELFRRFANAVVRPQSVLFVIGYGFGDEHVNAVIRQALAVPSFTLVVVDPKPTSDFVTSLSNQGDRRVWVCEGEPLGRLAGFVDAALPDLRDEDIREKVMATHRALSRTEPQGITF